MANQTEWHQHTYGELLTLAKKCQDSLGDLSQFFSVLKSKIPSMTVSDRAICRQLVDEYNDHQSNITLLVDELGKSQSLPEDEQMMVFETSDDVLSEAIKFMDLLPSQLSKTSIH